MNGTQEWEGAVNQKQHKHLFAMCQCGKVKFEAVGPPILTGGSSILKSIGSSPIPPPDGSSPSAVIRQCSSTSPRDTGCRCSGTAFR